VQIDALDFQTVVDRIVEHARIGGPPGYVVTPNAHHVVLLQTDAKLRSIYDNALLVVPDGVPLLWAAALLKQPLRGRVNGTDLVEAVCARSAAEGLRVFFLGGREGAAEAAARQLRHRYPALDICGTYCPPMGFERVESEQRAILQALADARPHVLFVGLGAPKQEYWMSDSQPHLDVPVSLGIGVSFELIGGIVRRAPRWMQVTGLEWLFRLLAEPRRLWRRYVYGNAVFCALVARQLVMSIRR
jgi:N-acetylglucosaminyldiphosphoundecaprenol N-acetyl-beta-D-mannosaminyltransferase